MNPLPKDKIFHNVGRSIIKTMCLTSQQNVSIVVERRIFFKLHQSYILPNIIIDHLDAKIQRSYSLISNYKL